MNLSIHDNDTALLHAFADGELDPATAIEVERRLASDSVLRAQYEALLSLRRAIRSIDDNAVPLDRLRAKIIATVQSRTNESRNSWRAIAAATLIGAVISAAATFVAVRQDPSREIAGFVVSNHIRSLLASQPFDIASSDRHTIKPWFTTKIPMSPPIIDLSADGFLLVGGRIDVVVGEPVATIVYRHGPHAISLTTLHGLQTVSGANYSGYNVSTWHDGDFTYVAVSDLPVIDLSNFERAFLKGVRR